MAQKTALMLLVLYTLLILGLLVLVVSGAHLYATALDSKDLHAERRSALSYIQTQAASCRGSVVVEESGDGQVLCLLESGYETRIYLYNNTLRSLLTRGNTDVDLARGDAICSLDQFQLDWVSDGLLKVQTDYGIAYIRCCGGAANG